jgi:hypothetical protein
MRNMLFVLMMLVAGVAIGQDFRNAKFGMSRADVKAGEEIKLTLSGDFLIGADKVSIAGYQMMVTFSFDEAQKLKGGMYTAYFNGGGEVVTAFNAIHQLLTKKYGENAEMGKTWTSETDKMVYGDDAKYDGYMIERGAMRPIALWYNGGTMIVLSVLKTENAGISLYVSYSAKADFSSDGIDKL